MANETNLGNSAASSSGSSIPRAVWIGGGVLCLVTAGLAGALFNRSVDKPTASAASSLTTPSSIAPTDEVEPPAKVAVVPAPAPAPARAAAPAPRPAPAARHEAVCRDCGVVQSVTEEREKGEGTGLGAVAGGVLGGVLGHQGGGGRGKTALTVLGAVGGGLAGNEVEKRTRGHTTYTVRVRMDDGSERTYHESNPISAGTHVVAEGDGLRVR